MDERTTRVGEGARVPDSARAEREHLYGSDRTAPHVVRTPTEDGANRLSAEYDATARAGSGDDSDDDPRIDQIRTEIDQTRAEMSETVEAIQDKLRPRTIVAQATESVRSAARERVNDMAQSASDTVGQAISQSRDAAGELAEGARRNPIPAMLVGVGTAWLLLNSQRSRSSSRRVWNRYGRDNGEFYGRDSGGFMDRVKRNPVPAALAGVGVAWLAFSGDRENGWAESDERDSYDEGYTYGTARDASAGVSTSSSTSERSTVAAMGDRGQQVARDLTTAARQKTRRAQNQFQRLMHNNPLVVGAAAMMVGAAVGAALPETEREREWMGEARESVIEGAQNLAHGAVTEAASEVVDRVIGQK